MVANFTQVLNFVEAEGSLPSCSVAGDAMRYRQRGWNRGGIGVLSFVFSWNQGGVGALSVVFGSNHGGVGVLSLVLGWQPRGA